MNRILFLGMLFFAPATLANSGEASHRLATGLWVGESLNDEPSVSATTFKPFLRYRYAKPSLHFSSLVGILFNRVDFVIPVNPLTLLAGADVSLTIAGDEPRIDGREYDHDPINFGFKAHRVRGYGGFSTKIPTRVIENQLRLVYSGEWYWIYNRPSAVNPFTSPQNFYDHGPSVRVSVGSSAPVFEIGDLGNRLALYSAYKWRANARAWGRSTFVRNVKHYYEGSVGGTTNFPVASNVVINTRGSAGFVSNADRLNAIQSGSLSQDSLGLTMDDVRADRVVNADSGVRISLSRRPYFSLKPFVHGVVYREITTDRFRVDSGIGGGMKLMGMTSNEKFYWEVTYANLFGTRPDLSAGLHVGKILVSYQIF